jgi:hypothetical protein
MPDASAPSTKYFIAASVARRIALQRDHRIERQRQQFEAEIERQKMVGRDHHHHAEQREQRQHEELALVHAAFAR